MYPMTREQDQAVAQLADTHHTVVAHPLVWEFAPVRVEGRDEDGVTEAYYVITPDGFPVPAEAVYVPSKDATIELSIRGQQLLNELEGELADLEAKDGVHVFDGVYVPRRRVAGGHQ